MKPNPNDVLKGRGVPIQNHPGNQYFRKVVASRKTQYALMTKLEDKEAIANQVFIAIQSQTPQGRFLEPTGNGEYRLLDRKSIMRKIKQALREKLEKKNTSYESKPPAKKSKIYSVESGSDSNHQLNQERRNEDEDEGEGEDAN